MAKKGTSDAKHHMSTGQRIRHTNTKVDALAATQDTLVDVVAQNTSDIQTLKLTVAQLQQKV